MATDPMLSLLQRKIEGLSEAEKEAKFVVIKNTIDLLLQAKPGLEQTEAYKAYLDEFSKATAYCLLMGDISVGHLTFFLRAAVAVWEKAQSLK